MLITRFGLHWLEGGIALLAQQNNVTNVTGTDLELDYEFKIRDQCPHQINLDQTIDTALPDDLLVNFFLPLPKTPDTPILLVEDHPLIQSRVRGLLRLSSDSPDHASIWPGDWMLTPPRMMRLLNLTNLSPLVIYLTTGALSRHMVGVIKASAYTPRKLLFIAPPNLVSRPEMVRANPPQDIDDVLELPLEEIGARRLRDYMLNPLPPPL